MYDSSVFCMCVCVSVCTYLNGGRGHLSSLVKVKGDNMGEVTGVCVHRRRAVAESLQDGVDGLPLLSYITKQENTPMLF